MSEFTKFERRLLRKYYIVEFLTGPASILLMAVAFAALILFASSCALTTTVLNFKDGRPMVRCQLPELYSVQADFDDKSLHSILNAFDYWNASLGKVFLDYSNDASLEELTQMARNSIVVVMGEDSMFSSPETLAFHRSYYRWVNNRSMCLAGSLIVIRQSIIERMSSPRLETIVRHEIGHALGLAHSPDPTELMFSRIPTLMHRPVDAGEMTIRILRKVYGRKDKETPENTERP